MAAVLTCTASGVAVVSGMCWRCCGAVIRSSVAQAAL
nr:MAG TPA: outer capsid protein sigma-1 attachment protein [Caudoviricetes sp.]